MPRATNQKIKLLILLELLRQETDEQHPMSTRVLCQKLSDRGISCDRRTLARDVALLGQFGYEIMALMQRHEKCYYIEDRSFSLPELKILMDAVQAAGFITEGKTRELLSKLAELGGSHRGELLRGSVIRIPGRKHKNESIYYSIDALEEATEAGQQVSFRYFHLDENGGRLYRHQGRTVTEPMALVFRNDNYYLMAYDSAEHKTYTYRVDRMEQVRVEEAPVSREALSAARELPRHIDQTIRMFGGPASHVTLEFDESLIGVVFDKFGVDTRMRRLDSGAVSATVTAQISPTFWGWLCEFPGKMRIREPESMAQQYRDWVKSCMDWALEP